MRGDRDVLAGEIGRRERTRTREAVALADQHHPRLRPEVERVEGPEFGGVEAGRGDQSIDVPIPQLLPQRARVSLEQRQLDPGPRPSELVENARGQMPTVTCRDAESNRSDHAGFGVTPG